MFTGIVSAIGQVREVTSAGAGRRIAIASGYDPRSITLGASIACAGVCLTVTACEPAEGGALFRVDASPETLERTTAGQWQAGTAVNLERALRLGDELGGHLVTGHVDAVARIVAREDQDAFTLFGVETEPALARFIAQKGSVALDGTSLTVNRVEGARFELMLIPHTLAVTTWGANRVGDRVNLEVDLMARYAARLMAGSEHAQALHGGPAGAEPRP